MAFGDKGKICQFIFLKHNGLLYQREIIAWYITEE